MSEIVKILTHSVNLKNTLEKTELHTLFVMGDNEAHRFEIEILNGREKVDLSGMTVTAYFTSFKEDTTVEVAGKVEDGRAVVVLSKPCYTLHGQFVLAIQIKAGEVENTVFLGEGYMRRSKGETIIYDDYIVYDVSTLLAQISAMKTATENATKAAADANAAAEHAPYVDAATGFWMYWDVGAGKYVSTGTPATGPKGAPGDTPYIGSNGNWWIGEIDTGTKAQGPAGQNGTGSGTVTGVEVNGQTYEPDQTGVVKLPELGGGDVQTVNGKKPDEAGNVQLDAESVGALPSGGTAADSNKLGGVEANEYARKTDIPEVEDIGLLTVYPVGSIYMSVNDTSPAALFGGTWEQLKDRFLLGAGSTYALGSMGGEEKHAVTIEEMPSHFHNVYAEWSGGAENVPAYFAALKSSAYQYFANASTGGGYTPISTAVNNGSNKPHNNMPPYLSVNMWKRVS